MKRTVRFYRAMIQESDQTMNLAPAGFWRGVHRKILDAPQRTRRRNVRTTPWFGDAGSGTSPAIEYIRCGRVRFPGEWPTVVDDEGRVIPLTLAEGNLFEAAYLVPLAGDHEKIAVVGPIRGRVAVSSIEAWLGGVLDFPALGKSLSLEPLIDEESAEKLMRSIGASRLEVTIPANSAAVPTSESSSEVERAIASSNGLGAELDRTFVFTYSNRKKGHSASYLLDAARALFTRHEPSKLIASLMLPSDDGVHTEVHDLLRDRIAVAADFDIDDQVQPGVDDMLNGIQRAISQFNSRLR